MYRCYKKIIISILLSFSVNLFANNVSNALEDGYILEALDAIDSKNYQGALEIYKNLYDITKKQEYLKEMINLSIQLGKHTDAIEYIKDYEKNDENDVSIKRYLAYSYMALNKINEAIETYKDIIKLENNKINNKVLSSLYLLNKDFPAARKSLMDAYEEEPDEHILILISSIDIMNKDFNSSIPLIKAYFPNVISDGFAQIINELAFSNNALKEAESLYLYYYDKNPNDINAKNLIRIYMMENDTTKAGELAKNHKLDDNLMIDLYMMQKDYKNARILTKKAFEQTQDSTYLGILAIIDFEDASDKKTVLPQVIENFKKSLKDRKNHMFYNYLGYLLIDFDVDIDEGIKYVNEALKLDPNNYAYIDSLAWGFYKKNDCENAKKIIDRISPAIIEQEDEVKEHLEIIKKCLKK